MSYLLNYDEIKNLKISELKEKINVLKGLPLSECTISKLAFYNGNPIRTGNGVYIFYRIIGNKKEYTYVGMCSSHSFVGRIPAHFNINRTGWFNSYLRTLVNKNRETNNEPKIRIKDFQSSDLEDNGELYNSLLQYQGQIALNNDNVLIINFKPLNHDRDHIKKLEKLFNKILIKNDNNIIMTKTLAEYIESILL